MQTRRQRADVALQRVEAGVQRQRAATESLGAKPGDALFTRLEADARRIAKRRAAALEAWVEQGDGTTLANRSMERWAAIVPSPSSSLAGYRALYFDHGGFSGHDEHASAADAVVAAANAGFMRPDPGRLDRLFPTPAFQRGLAIDQVIGALKRHTIDFEEAEQQAAAIHARYAEALGATATPSGHPGGMKNGPQPGMV